MLTRLNYIHTISITTRAQAAREIQRLLFRYYNPKHPVFCMWAQLMYPADQPHTARAPEKRVGGAGVLRYVQIGLT